MWERELNIIFRVWFENRRDEFVIKWDGIDEEGRGLEVLGLRFGEIFSGGVELVVEYIRV